MPALRLPVVPASYFGMVLGLACLAGSWRAAHFAWGVPALVGEIVMLADGLIWILREPFAPSYWAFTFGVTALATAPVRLIALGDDGTVLYLAPALFVFANLVVLTVVVGALYRFIGPTHKGALP